MECPSHERPTEQDQRNARVRREIADRQQREYGECFLKALGAFGPGWVPSHRHYLLEKEEEEKARHTGERPVAAKTVYTVRNARGDTRHFTVDDGRVMECAGYEEGFGTMLLEPHPTRGFEQRGQFCRTHRFSLCWAGYELYTPRTAEQLVILRESRERKKADREDQKWREENPLFAGLTDDEKSS